MKYLFVALSLQLTATVAFVVAFGIVPCGGIPLVWQLKVILAALGVALTILAVSVARAAIIKPRHRRFLWNLGLFLPETGSGKFAIGLRRALRAIGPTVVASPLRRLCQACCLLLFLWLFFYVCWPYRAQPVPPGRVSAGWRFAGVQQTTAQFLFANNSSHDWRLQPGKPVYVVEEIDSDVTGGLVARFTVIHWDDGSVSLDPDGEIAPETFDRLLLGAGPWSLYEHAPDLWPSHYADDLAAKERWLPADLFLKLDPLVSLSAAIAARRWVGSLLVAAAVLIVCLVIPRGFCGYVCPLGTVIDLSDWAIFQRIRRFRVGDNGWWVHLKYFLLVSVLVCSMFGVLVSGYVSAIPVITRGLMFLGEPVQSGVVRGWHQIPPWNAGHLLSISLLLGVLALGLMRPRFWCKYVCPSGALFSLGNLLRLSERKVEWSCIHCNQCVEICPFDAIKPDYTTRGTDCTLCQSCGGVCPTGSIKFVERWNRDDLKSANEPETGETNVGRRGFLSWIAGTAAAIASGTGFALVVREVYAANLGSDHPVNPLRPPGSVPEQSFLQLCIRCGECFKVCPNNVLQPWGFEQGLEGLWTPFVNADWAGCETSCNACGQVCPTGAIRSLSMDEKRVAHMGRAVVDELTCLPFAGREDCQLCVDECASAGYDAIEFTRTRTKVDAQGLPIEASSFLAPKVIADKCVGCGLCQMRCYTINAKNKRLLQASAIVVLAGEGREDRLFRGSYRELREMDARRREQERLDRIQSMPQQATPPPADPLPGPLDSEDPFGIGPRRDDGS